MDNKKLMQQDDPDDLSMNKTEELIRLLTERGYLEDRKIQDEKLRKTKRDRIRKTYHNTLLLLQHYRTIVWVMECFPSEIAEELEVPMNNIDLLLDRVDVELDLKNRRLENRMMGIHKSRLLIDRINDALTVLKHKPDNGEMLYQLIYQTYIAPDQVSHTELLYRLDISSRHYYRLKKAAISVISLRLWSSPDMDVDFWLEMISLLEEM